MARSSIQTAKQPEVSSGQAALRRSPRKKAPSSDEPATQRKSSILREIRLPSNEDQDDFETAITSAQRARPSTKLSEIDSINMSLSKVSLRNNEEDSLPEPNQTAAKTKAKTKTSTHYTSRFVMKEADCIDNYSDDDEDGDEATDLSGFIVDDDVDISYHISSGEDEFEQDTPEQKRPQKQTRRRLQRGHRRVLDSDESDKENGTVSPRAEPRESVATDNKPAEIIDLTSSPEVDTRTTSSKPQEATDDPFAADDDGLTKSLKGLSLFDSMLRLSPPRREHAEKLEPKIRDKTPDYESSSPPGDGPHTPPRPRTPPRLASPSKLLSPSKRNLNHRSPHRQSTDAFWDHNTVNDWNDEYSPKKGPLASPNKTNPFARFAIFSDSPPSSSSDTDSAHALPSSSPPLPSPCASPTKPISPEKATRLALLAEKKASAARKAAFNTTKHNLAADLLAYLDENVTNSQLEKLSKSTGGVQVTWSKTLRSTAGRANWRRSVTRLGSGSPVKGSPVKSKIQGQKGDEDGTIMLVRGERVKVEHFATIELAEKVIDSEERLVNTLAHEFCHLANFMVSGVRDQPHGASFREWAAKATGVLAKAVKGRAEEGEGRDERVRESWAKCKVTTKHSYEIEWKYLWGCVGREQSEAMRFLGVEGGEGCGAEYGRHSRSIDTERMRCGRCKGRLVQLRPTPRAGWKKGRGAVVGGGKAKGAEREGEGGRCESVRSSSGGSVGGLGKLKEIEVVELSD